MDQRAPMSERQQLALIKQIERTSATGTHAGANALNSGCSGPSTPVTSPSRAPLQVVNGPSQHRAAAAAMASSEAAAASPSSSSPAMASPGGAASSSRPPPRTPAEDRLRKRMERINVKGESQLHRAAIKGNKKFAEILLVAGKIDPNAKDYAGYTALHEACNRGQLSVAKVLVRHGADVNLFGGMNEQRESPLHDAAKNGYIELVKFLVKKGANLNAKNDSCRTPLDEVKLIRSQTENESLDKVVQFLTEHQENSLNLNEVDTTDSDSDSEDGKEETENDLARFLGLTYSPSIEQALQAIGATDAKGALRHKGKKPKRLSESTSKKGLDFTMEGDKAATTSSASTDANPSGSSGTATAQGGAQKTGDDVYEFKSSSKEATPVSSRASSSPDPNGEKKDKEKQQAEKRAANEDNEEEETKKKKQRKDELKESAKSGRSTRGSSSEKTSGKGSGKGRSGSSGDRRSPSSLSNSAANSPKKPKEANDQSDSDDENSKKSTDSSGLKVPPLKIVLSGSGGNPEEGKKAGGPSSGKKDEAEASGAAKKDDKGEDSGSGAKDDSSGDNTSTTKGASGSRMTRSRANQGTPGPEGSGSDAPGPSEAGASGNLQEATSTSSGASGSGNAGGGGGNNERSERSNYGEYSHPVHAKKRKLRSQVDEPGSSQNNSNANGGNGGARGAANANEPLNDIQKYLNIRKQVEQRRKNLFPVHPKPPQGFRDYLMNRKTYLLQGNAHERLRSMPMIQPPPSLDGAMRELFVEQEKARYQLRKRHLVEKEKLVLTVEQEIIRVHGRAARALANQPFPYSVCTILRDEEIYTPIDSQQEEKNRDIRSRYNGRLFLSWLQDVDDKWEKIKEQMVLRHHNEAESLNAVQKMDWEWKVAEISGNATSDNVSMQVDDLYIPMVHVSDDFDLSDNR